MSGDGQNEKIKRASQESQTCPIVPEPCSDKHVNEVVMTELCSPDKDTIEVMPGERPESPGGLSIRSDISKDLPINFNREGLEKNSKRERRVERAQSPTHSYESMKTSRSMDPPITFDGDIPSNLSSIKPDGIEHATRGALGELSADVCVENWTTEQVREWLTRTLKVPESVAQMLYDQEVSGGCLICFEKKDLLDLGLKYGPAVQIIKNLDMLRKKAECLERSANSTDTFHDTKVEESPRTKEQAVDMGMYEHTQETESVISDSDGHMGTSWMSLERSDVNTEDTNTLERRICIPRPFDENHPSFTYTLNSILPPVTSPSDLIDPVHEYILLPNKEEVSEREVLYEFCKEALCFAASCMNSRTNGTIHFGVSGASGDTHGQVVGQKVSSVKDYIDEFQLRLEQHFEENKRIAQACIRSPKFLQLKNLDSTTSDKCVIEVDVIPKHLETQEKLFYTYLNLTPEGQDVKFKTQCLFIRHGPKSINVLADSNPRTLQEQMRLISEEVKDWASTRKSKEMEKNYLPPKQGHQGLKLKQLMTNEKDTLENSLQIILVTNKCHHSQLEHLNFLKEIKLLAVLEFDPESSITGTCSFYRKDRIANQHFPRMYNTQDNVSDVIAKLNLFKQTSWVFCNGRANEESEEDKPLKTNDWLKKRAGDISNLVSFLCNPDVVPKSNLLTVFILHSLENDISSPIMETFCAIYRTMEGMDNLVCICKDSTVFSQWKDLIEARCKVDITSKCIYDLSLNEIDCTIRKLKEPQTQSSRRYLPSTGSSSVLLTKKDEELMTVLEILCENECENTEIEINKTFKDFKTKTEEDFYRGGQVTWWNFFLSEMPGCLPFIKRDNFNNLRDLITLTGENTFPCVMINLFHHPGCGGTTMAMHTLWSLRQKFRCAILKNNIAQNSEIAVQVLQLLNCGRNEQSSYTPVLLLVDNRDDVEDLQRCILNTARETTRPGSPLVIILNCERTQFPSECSRNSRTDSVFITNKLSSKEQSFFNEKLKDLKDHHERPETFYAFMIMTNNFSEEYIEKLVRNITKDLDTSSKEGKLLSFLAALNTYMNGSYMSCSLCKELLGIQNVFWKQQTLEDKMNPYSTLLICFHVEENGTYEAVRFLHQMIASKCIQVLIKEHKILLGEIITNILHCDLLYKSYMGKDILVQNIQSMLVTRHQKVLGNDKDTLFSPLIEDIREVEGTEIIKNILVRATERFEKNATIPQALARHFYLKEKDFLSAVHWAQDAQQKKQNSYIADTLGQVYKSQMKHELAEPLTPEGLDRSLNSASKAIKAFRDSQELAKRDESADPSDQRYRRRQKNYNTSGYVGEMDVTMILFDIIKDIPFFDKSVAHQKDRMLQFLNGHLHVKDFHEESTLINDQFIATLLGHEKLLVSLKPRLKEMFTFFENYFTYLKPRSIERETADDRNKKRVTDHFKKYIQVFCVLGTEKALEKKSKPHLNLSQEIADKRSSLEEKRADSFAGLLQCLIEKNPNQMEHILKTWQFIVDNSTRHRTSDRVNFILANIVLHCLKPSSVFLKKYEELVSLLSEALHEEGISSNCTELYYLSMLLMWPSKCRTPKNTALQNISTYVTASKRSFSRRFQHMFPARSAISHFYLGNSKELKRIISKAKLDHALNRLTSSHSFQTKDQLWRSGAIWKEPEVQRLLVRVKGKTENGDIYIHYDGNVKIQVRPVYLGGVRPGCSVEAVSFYLGFSMDGPVAYDLQYDNAM